ncbi:hypothetical protein PPE03_11700 [Pseudoalteromonas peptidolytica]|nr:hypothetical protein PPE03_11700 [Pseudoalteromonas peptidolytica]
MTMMFEDNKQQLAVSISDGNHLVGYIMQTPLGNYQLIINGSPTCIKKKYLDTFIDSQGHQQMAVCTINHRVDGEQSVKCLERYTAFCKLNFFKRLWALITHRDPLNVGVFLSK